MSQPSSDFDRDKTVIDVEVAPAATGKGLPFAPVAVAPGRQSPPDAPYLSRQTSLDDYAQDLNPRVKGVITPGLNPLVKAASHLLLEIVTIRQANDMHLGSLHSRLAAEIRGVSSQAMASGVSESQVNVAQYLLCTALDEAVVTSRIPGAEDTWPDNSLLSTFHNDTWGGEVFFEVLARAMEQPARLLYLLEFIYLLLSLGFEGKYSLEDRGSLALESLRDQLYRQIRILRGEPSPDLAKKLPPPKFKNRMYAYVPTWLVIILLLTCLSVTYWGFFYALDNRAQPLLAQFDQHAPPGKLFMLKEKQPEPSSSAAAEPLSEPTPEKGADIAPGSTPASETRP
jgi:type VI secretion system protein ImpK